MQPSNDILNLLDTMNLERLLIDDERVRFFVCKNTVLPDAAGDIIRLIRKEDSNSYGQFGEYIFSFEDGSTWRITRGFLVLHPTLISPLPPMNDLNDISTWLRESKGEDKR